VEGHGRCAAPWPDTVTEGGLPAGQGSRGRGGGVRQGTRHVMKYTTGARYPEIVLTRERKRTAWHANSQELLLAGQLEAGELERGNWTGSGAPPRTFEDFYD